MVPSSSNNLRQQSKASPLSGISHPRWCASPVRRLSLLAHAQPLPAPASGPALQQGAAPERPPPPPTLQRAGDLSGDVQPHRSELLLRDYRAACLTPQYTEFDYYVPPDAVYGTLPDDLTGTLFLVGPGLTEGYGTSVRHPADADGMVCSLAFGQGGRVFFRNRYVRTPSFLTEQALGRRVSRGLHDRGAPTVSGQPHSTPPPSGLSTSAPAANATNTTQQQQQHQQAPDNEAAAALRIVLSALSGSRDAPRPRPEEEDAWATGAGGGGGGPQRLRLDPLALLGLPPMPMPMPPLSSLFNPLDTAFRSPANAGIVCWGGRLLVFSEGGSMPYELNRMSLETVGLYDVAGAMGDIGRLVGGYKIAPAPPPPGRTGGGAGGGARAQRLVLMGCAQSGPDVLLRWAELGEDGALAGQATTYRMAGASAQGVLDFWVTERHYIVVQAPLDFNPQRFLAKATVGAASFAECFDWDASRPSRIHIVARPAAAAAPKAAAAAGPQALARQAAAGQARGDGRSATASIVWPAKGPDALVVDVQPLLPTACIGCYSPHAHAGEQQQQLVLDAVCQQGLSGSGQGTLDNPDPRGHWQQPKPELTRLVVDLQGGTATARVLSQRCVTTATTAAAFGGGSSSGGGAASGPLAAVGGGNSQAGGYHHLFASASATEAAAGWAPPQVLTKLSLPPQHGVPSAAASAAVPSAPAAASPPAPSGPAALAWRRGTGAELWSPGDRVFIGPPVFVPRRVPGAATAAATSAATAAAPPAPGAATPAAGSGGGPLPPLESEVEAAAHAAAAGAAAVRQRQEQEGWLLVVLHDADGERAELCVLDAGDLTRGPVAVVALPHGLPLAAAAAFTAAYCGPGQVAPKGWRPSVGGAGPAARPPAGSAR